MRDAARREDQEGREAEREDAREAPEADPELPRPTPLRDPDQGEREQDEWVDLRRHRKPEDPEADALAASDERCKRCDREGGRPQVVPGEDDGAEGERRKREEADRAVEPGGARIHRREHDPSSATTAAAGAWPT